MSCLGQDSTRDVLRARQTLYQLSHRGSSAGQAKSLKFMQGKAVSPLMDRVTNLSIKDVYMYIMDNIHEITCA